MTRIITGRGYSYPFRSTLARPPQDRPRPAPAPADRDLRALRWLALSIRETRLRVRGERSGTA